MKEEQICGSDRAMDLLFFLKKALWANLLDKMHEIKFKK